MTEMTVRCRECTECKRYHARHWAYRIRAELGCALLRGDRAWFVTLTLRPEEHYRAVCEAGSDTFDARHRAISKWITRYLKRLRENSAAKFRYCLVAEAHPGKKSQGENFALPHYHVVIIEMGTQLRKKVIQGEWPYGFSTCKLVQTKENGLWRAAWYVAKYLSKDARARVRASLHFGDVDWKASLAASDKSEPEVQREYTSPNTPEED